MPSLRSRLCGGYAVEDRFVACENSDPPIRSGADPWHCCRGDRVESFDQYAGSLTHRHAKLMGLGFALAVLLLWPFDRALYGADPEVTRAFVLWRAGAIALCGGGVLVL